MNRKGEFSEGERFCRHSPCITKCLFGIACPGVKSNVEGFCNFRAASGMFLPPFDS